MFYEPGKTDHGLSKNPFNSLIIPRPIGWISSVDKVGIVNLAPYSFFNAVSYRPPIVMFSGSRGNSSPDDTHKDSQRNIEETGCPSHRSVLFQEAAVLHRHLPPAELGKARAGGAVSIK